MKTIKQVFRNLKKQGRRALIPYITAGDPDLETTKKLILTVAQSGGDILELGVPFSDPLADGPTIQAASQRALKSGTNLKEILKLIKEIRPYTEIPIVLMSYYNPLLQYGLERLAQEAVKAGINGFIVPDLTPEEADKWIKICRIYHLDTIFLIAPTTPLSRARKIVQKSQGFIYYVSVTGVTGARDKLPSDIIQNLNQLKRITKKPIAVGFGISSPEHVKMLIHYADGIIVGSAIVKIIGNSKNTNQILKKVSTFIKSLSQATKL
ncbi:MAG TPA: tryptophan synthase subunit alpha [Candidatus Desulfofervidus auxilii]|uniref:Tryptophan synthase alpha chain n=1 Tax=Desulfofervidus auxilii TaxID=1621989 RepID=A0A7C0Y1X1_DESA2|nr:tryptophan synthase subunit alpha [Candidatus Desulfofervidus auxilii]